VPVKILAVDDSATMRKIMKMTFAGEDAEVLTVADPNVAIDKAVELKPDVVFADASMAPMDGYGVAQAIKQRAGNVAVILMASQHTPFDEAKASSSGVDDHVAKPFDSQIVIDKVAQVLSRPRASAAAAAKAPTGPGSPVKPAPRSGKHTVAFDPKAAKPAPKPVLELAEDEPELTIDIGEPEPPKPAPKPAKPAPPPPKPAPPKPAPTPVRASPRPAPKPPEPAKPAPKPAPEPAKPAPAKAAPKPAAAAAAVDGMAGKLEGLGLTKEQIEGVLALSREVVEQVVWEVVPDLAEVLIREEIERLTAD